MPGVIVAVGTSYSSGFATLHVLEHYGDYLWWREAENETRIRLTWHVVLAEYINARCTGGVVSRVKWQSPVCVTAHAWYPLYGRTGHR